WRSAGGSLQAALHSLFQRLLDQGVDSGVGPDWRRWARRRPTQPLHRHFLQILARFGGEKSQLRFGGSLEKLDHNGDPRGWQIATGFVLRSGMETPGFPRQNRLALHDEP